MLEQHIIKMSKKVKVFQFKEDYTNSVTKLISEKLKKLLSNSSDIITVALSGGTTPLPILTQLSEENIDWQRISFFIVDERCVPIEHADSNFGNIKKVFFDKIKSKSYSVIQPNREYDDCANMYQKTILEIVPKSNDFPRFDIILLGMGDDGHTASLFPKTSALKENNELVVLNQVPQLETQRITFTYPLILNSTDLFLLFKGENKKQILSEILEGKEQELPIVKVLNECSQITILTD